MKTQRLSFRIFALSVLFAVFFAALCSVLPHDNMWLGKEGVTPFNDGWTLISDNGNETVSLPFKANVKKNTPVILEKNLPNPLDTSNSPRVFTIFTSHQFMKLYLEDELIYEFGGAGTVPAFSKTPGSAWNTVRLSPEAAGKRVRLELTSPYSLYSGHVQPVHMGTKAAVLYWLLQQNAISFAFSLIFILAGIVLSVAYIIFRKLLNGDKSLLYISWFTLLLGLWLLFEGRLTQLFAQNVLVYTNLSVFFMMLAAVPLIYFISSTNGFTRKKSAMHSANAISITAMAIALCQCFGIFDVYELVPIGAGIVVTMLCYNFYLLNSINADKKDKQFYLSVLAVGLFAVCCLIEFINYLAVPTSVLGKFVEFGAAGFTVVMCFATFEQTSNILRRSRESTYYEKLAMRDQLTGCLNRTAFSLFSENMKCEAGCVAIMCDLDGLKGLNDNFGHSVGDDAIKRCGNALSEAFGACYRIGGDEFACLLTKQTKESISNGAENFSQICKKTNNEVDYPFYVSLGFSFYEEADTNLVDIIERADKNMYENKNKRKAAQGIGVL